MMGPLSGKGHVDEKHLHEPVALGKDVHLGPFELADRVIAACQSLGENWKPPHEWSTYAFWRTGAPYVLDGLIKFDVDRRLSTCIQLSRLVRPTSIGYYRAARLITWPGKALEIVPARYQGRGTIAVVIDTEQDWIRDADIQPIRDLFAAFKPDALPKRVKRALMYHEYAHGLADIDVRWPIIVTAAEALVHTDERKKIFGKGGMAVTEQFVLRLDRLAQRFPAIDWDKDYLRDAYEHRSSFAHGGGLGAMTEQGSIAMYSRMEKGLREILREAILNPASAAIFANDGDIRAALNA